MKKQVCQFCGRQVEIYQHRYDRLGRWLFVWHGTCRGSQRVAMEASAEELGRTAHDAVQGSDNMEHIGQAILERIRRKP